MPTSRSTPRFSMVLLYTSLIAVFLFLLGLYFFHTVHLVLYLIHSNLIICPAYESTRCAYLRNSVMRPPAESCVHRQLFNEVVMSEETRILGSSMPFVETVLFRLFMLWLWGWCTCEHRAHKPQTLRSEIWAPSAYCQCQSGATCPFRTKPVVPKGKKCRLTIGYKFGEEVWWLAI